MRKFVKLVAILAFAVSSQVSHADLVFDLDTLVNGSSPTDSGPWLTATFHTVSTGDVTLTLTNDMTSPQFITEVAFNSLIDPTSLTFTRTDSTSTVPSSSVSTDSTQDLTGGSSLKAGLFNIAISFGTSGGTSKQFNSGNNSVIFNITGSGLTEDSFNLLSLDGGTGFLGTDYLMAAKVQGIPIPGSNKTTSGSIGYVSVTPVPEPQVYAMMGVGLLLMGFVAHRRRQRDPT